MNDERSALSRLDDILGSETRTAVASNDLVEIVRVTKGRQPLHDEELEKTGTVLPSNLPDIELGRGAIEQQITERARQKIEGFGIELLDERFKRSKYSPAVAEKIIERMSSERHQIASKFRSEGRGEAANINGQKESDVASIQSAATRNALKIEGEADAEAARIYTAAYARRRPRPLLLRPPARSGALWFRAGHDRGHLDRQRFRRRSEIYRQRGVAAGSTTTPAREVARRRWADDSLCEMKKQFAFCLPSQASAASSAGARPINRRPPIIRMGSSQTA